MRLPRFLSLSASSPSRRLIPIIVLGLVSVLAWTHFHHGNGHGQRFALYTKQHTGPLVDVASILQDVPSGQEDSAWTDEDAVRRPYVAGTKATTIQLDDKGIIDVRTGEPIQHVNEGSTFNLAVLKLPHGSKWGFVGVARGPTRQRDFMSLQGSPSREQVLVAMGLNITGDGQLFAVTAGQTLDLPMIPTESCIRTGAWVATYGAEDPRLFWTDAGTPALTFARASDDINLCRSVGLVTDLRELFPDLDEAMVAGVEGVTPYDGYKEPGEGRDREMRRKENQGPIEKNWMPFFPNALPNGKTLYPHIHYHLLPDTSLRPVEVTPRQVIYEDVDFGSSDAASCVSDYHPRYALNHKIHQASPLYRLTLCDRGCVVTEQNTVNIALSHTQTPTRKYGRFIAATNITYPFNPISVGPQFHLDGCDDENDINYALTLVPIQKADLDAISHLHHQNNNEKPIRTPQDVLPNHFFLDDKMLITLGHNDMRMISVLTTVQEVLGRQKMCKSAST